MTPTAEERISHYVKPVKGTRVPGSLVFVDTETTALTFPDDPGKEHHVLRLGVAVHVRRDEGKWERRKVLEFTQPDEFWAWVDARLSPRRPTWIFAHNAGFDMTALRLWERLDSGALRLRESRDERERREARPAKARREWRGACVIEDPPTILRLRGDGGTVVIIDTVNYLPMCLEEIGNGLGLEKLPMPVPEAPDAHWRAYCRRDVEILERAICGLIDAWERSEAGAWQGTAASLAYNAWKRSIPPKTVLIDHDGEHTALGRAAYFGGHTEAFYVGPVDGEGARMSDWSQSGRLAEIGATRGPIFHVDVRSMYASLMLGSRFPVLIRGVWPTMDAAELAKRLIQLVGVAEVRLDTRTSTYPLRIGKRVVYAQGIFWTTLAGDELVGALDRGHVVGVGRVALYYGANIFDKYVETWWCLRERAIAEGHHSDDMFGKMMLNSLTGYFAKRRPVWIDRFDLAPHQSWGAYTAWDATARVPISYRAIAGHVQQRQDAGESRESFPAISACITAAGREKMRWYRSFCPPRTVLYQDTDCLFLLRPGYDALCAAGLVGGTHLGALRLVKEYPDGEVFGPKDYRLGDTVVIAGVKRPNDVGRDGKYTQDTFERLQSVIARGPDSVVTVTETENALSRQYGKDRASKEGWMEPHFIMSLAAVPDESSGGSP